MRSGSWADQHSLCMHFQVRTIAGLLVHHSPTRCNCPGPGLLCQLAHVLLNCLRGLGQVSNYSASLILGERQTHSPLMVSSQFSVLWFFCSGSEMLSKSARVTFITVGHSLGFGIGYALLPFFAYFIRGWKMLLVASAVPCFLFIPVWW